MSEIPTESKEKSEDKVDKYLSSSVLFFFQKLSLTLYVGCGMLAIGKGNIFSLVHNILETGN
mgnify:CR=1 FL=1